MATLIGSATVICILTSLLGSSAFASSCQPGLARDYLAPLAKLPRQPTLEWPNKTMPFGPAGLSLIKTSKIQHGYPLVVNGSGFKSLPLGFALLNENDDRLTLAWTMSDNLYRLPMRGRSPVASMTTRVGSIRGTARKKLEVAVPTTSGNYLLEVDFRRRGAQKLVGRLAEYFRVLQPTVEPQVVLSASSVRPGETIEACLENFGTAFLSYGEGMQIEVNNGSIWQPSPLDPPGPTSDILNFVGPGQRRPLANFTVPYGAEPGLYRYSWYADPGSVNLAPEFNITP